MRRATACIWAGVAAAALAVCLALAAHTLPERIEASVMAGIRDQIVWQPDSPQAVAARFRGDVDPSLPPVHASFRFFNLTNLAAVRLGAKPVLKEVGPYTFRLVRRKTNIRWVDGDAAVQWQEYKYHLWEPELSNGSMQDPITTLNLPLIGALETIGRLPAGRAAWLLELLLSWVERLGDHRVQGLFTTRTAGELLWGYQDPLLVQLARWIPGINPTFRLAHNMTSAAEAAQGLPTQAATGVRGLQGVWQTQRWRGISELTCWNPPHKEAVRGTDASQFRPGLALNDTVDVWVSDLYRAARLVVREAVPLEGVPLLRLRADPTQGDPDPRFFQSIRGLMNVTTPTVVGPSGHPGKPGPPIFLSYPHYCGADPLLARGVEGLACDPPAHDLFVDVEPNTGITLRAAKRLMMSSWFGPKWGTIDPSVRPTFLPIFWAELASQAKGPQLRHFRPLLRARAAQRALHTYAVPLAEALALLAVACFCVATVLWSDQGGNEEGDAEKRSAAAAGVAEAGEQRVRPPPREPLCEPLLDSHPLPSQDAGAAAEEAVAAAAVSDSP